jgi:hypothetical protein
MNRKILYLFIVTLTIVISCKTTKKVDCDAYGKTHYKKIEKVSKK